MTTVCITGATGFLGAHLTAKLASGALGKGTSVRVAVRNPRRMNALDGLEVEQVRADVMDRKSMRAALEGSDAPGAEERRRDLDALLERAVPASPDAGADGRAVLGAFLEVEDADGGRRVLRLVGADEADASRGWVRVDSPLGTALLGRQAGDTVVVERPRDTLELRILRVYAAG